jgi:hypothetical protein
VPLESERPEAHQRALAAFLVLADDPECGVTRTARDTCPAAIGLALGIGLVLLVLAVRALRCRGPLAHL